MNIEYSNQVTGSDFRTTSENFTIEGKFRKDAASGTVIELHASVRATQEPAGSSDEIGFWGGKLRYTLYGRSADQIAEIIEAIENTVNSLSTAEPAAE